MSLCREASPCLQSTIVSTIQHLIDDTNRQITQFRVSFGILVRSKRFVVRHKNRFLVWSRDRFKSVSYPRKSTLRQRTGDGIDRVRRHSQRQILGREDNDDRGNQDDDPRRDRESPPSEFPVRVVIRIRITLTDSSEQTYRSG
jgi:hypothetical protein